MERYRGKKERFFYKIFSSYFIIILIALSLVVINVSKTTSISEKQDEEFYISNLKVVQDMVEIKISSMRNLFLQITNNNWAENLMLINHRPEEQELDNEFLNSYDTFEAIKDLSHYKNSVNGVEVLGIFYKKGDFVIDNTSITHASDYFRDIFRMDGIDVNNWYSLASTFQSFNVLPNNKITFNNKQITGTTFYKTIPPNDSNVNGLVFAVINRGIFSNALHALEIDEDTYGVIVDENNLIIASTENDYAKIPLLNYSALEESGTSGSMKENEYKYYTGKMNFVPWKIVLITRTSSAPSLLTLPGYYLPAVLIILFLSVAASYFMSVYSYKPLYQLYKSISIDNGFRGIESEISNINEHNLRLQKQIDGYKSGLTERYLYSQIFDEATTNTYNNIAERFHTDFQIGKATYVIMIGIQGNKEKQKLSRVTLNLQRFMKTQGAVTYLIQDLEQRSVLFVWLSEVAEDQGNNDINGFVKRIIQYKNKLASKFAMKIQLGIGTGFKQAEESYRFNVLFNDDIYVHVDEGEGLASQILSLETERKLINYIAIGEFEKIHDLISQLIVGDCNKQNASDGAVLYYELVAIPLKHCDSEVLKAFIADKLASTPPESLEEVMVLYKEICDRVKLIDLQQAVESQDLKKEMISFIDQNYLNPDMSLKLVKDRFDISFSLITRLVKQESGFGFLEYISRLRLDYAKNLMQRTDESITRIRELTGFNDDSNFIKVFKKYEGVTPGEYKKRWPPAKSR